MEDNTETLDDAHKEYTDACFAFRVITPEIPEEIWARHDYKYNKDIADWREAEIRKRYTIFKEKIKPFEEIFNEKYKKYKELIPKNIDTNKDKSEKRIYVGGINPLTFDRHL